MSVLIVLLLIFISTMLFFINRNFVLFNRKYIEINKINMLSIGQNFDILFTTLDEVNSKKSSFGTDELDRELTKRFQQNKKIPRR